jgi:sphingolipid delta-4 desaturase
MRMVDAVDDGRFHRERRAEILRDRPEVKRLFGNSVRTAYFAAGVVAGQFTLAAAVADQPWWVVLIASYGVGAFASHYLNVVMHECAHNLVLRSTALNKAIAIFANLPALTPGAIPFRHYHLLHHRFLGRRGLDADVAMPWEVRLVGRSPFCKFLWLLVQPFTYGILHPLQVRRRIPFDGWLAANIAVVAGAAVAATLAFGPLSLLYLGLSSYFSLGPHPTGAHVLQEHFIFEGDGETTSYYGPMNAISINHGLHLEHHDFPNVPGAKLAELRRIAPQHYGGRFHHRSRLETIWRFVMDRRIALDTRAVRSETFARLEPSSFGRKTSILAGGRAG